MKRSDDEIGKIRTNANAIRKGFKINIKYVLQLTQLVCIVTWHKARFKWNSCEFINYTQNCVCFKAQIPNTIISALFTRYYRPYVYIAAHIHLGLFICCRFCFIFHINAAHNKLSTLQSVLLLYRMLRQTYKTKAAKKCCCFRAYMSSSFCRNIHSINFKFESCRKP